MLFCVRTFEYSNSFISPHTLHDKVLISVVEGLPGITGQASFSTYYADGSASSAKGALYRGFINLGFYEYSNAHNGDLSYFDASRSSPIYGTSSNVTPSSLQCTFYVKY